MDAQTAPRARRPESPSTSRLKHQICASVQQLAKTSTPVDYHQWAPEKMRAFLLDVQGCHTGRSLHGLQLSALRVIESYGVDPRDFLPAEMFR